LVVSEWRLGSPEKPQPERHSRNPPRKRARSYPSRAGLFWGPGSLRKPEPAAVAEAWMNCGLPASLATIDCFAPARRGRRGEQRPSTPPFFRITQSTKEWTHPPPWMGPSDLEGDQTTPFRDPAPQAGTWESTRKSRASEPDLVELEGHCPLSNSSASTST
jgi:hypothetical protein